MKNLKEKSVLVTGAGGGIGKAIATRFAEEGAKLLICDIDLNAAIRVAEELGGQACRIDVGDENSVEAAVAKAVQAFGRIDVLINNAGVQSLPAPIHQFETAEWDRVLRINLTGVFYGMRSALRHFVAQGSGNIVNISSIAAMVACVNLPPYNAAKAGVSQLTREGAAEYAALGIRVNAVAPTAIMTEMNEVLASSTGNPEGFRKQLTSMNPMKGTPAPEDIAAAVVFLASDDARFITGVTLPVDGGYTTI